MSPLTQGDTRVTLMVEMFRVKTPEGTLCLKYRHLF